MENKERTKKGNGSAIGGIIFVGCMFLGAGVGMYFNALKIGGAIGMGVGFISMGFIKAYYKN